MKGLARFRAESTNGHTDLSRLTPIILAVAMFMEMMDATVIATSLPAIAEDIGTEPIALKLAMTAYLVALAIFIPISGWMADRFGAKNVFRWAMVVFMLGSVACAFSFSLETFVASRFFQGMGGAMMTPLARLVLARTTPRHDLVNAMAWLSMPALVGPMLGPPVGGFLTTYLSWHWIFFINIPIGLLGILGSTLFLPDIPPGERRPLDWVGFVLCGVAFSGTLFGLSVISLPALPPIYGALSMLAGVAAAIAYVWHIRHTEHPLLDPKIFRNPLFRSAVIGGFIFRTGMGAIPFLLPLMLQLGFGLTPFETGLITLFGAVGAIGAKLFAKPVYAAFGFRDVTLLMSFLSAILLAAKGLFMPDTPWWVMIAVLFGAGLVRSTFFTGVNAMSFADVSQEETGQATAIFAVLTQLSFAFGVALAGGLLEVMSVTSGQPVGVADFQRAFFFIGGFALFAFVPFLLMPRDAGSDVSGHGRSRDLDSGDVPIK